MSSTYSSEQGPKQSSATEILASRYRHLFVLPSSPQLLVYGGAASLALTITADGLAGFVWFLPILSVYVLSAGVISRGIRAMDGKTIATFRRVQALLFTGAVLWLVVWLVGAAYGRVAGSSSPDMNTMLFGAFLCAGMEFLVIDGAFLRREGASLVLAAVHPLPTLSILALSRPAWSFNPLVAALGTAAVALVAAFPLALKRRRTSMGHDALSLFQSFMKTWAGGNSDDLERVIEDHSETIEVATKVLRFRTKRGDTFLVLPGVHPGPFHPVGSYDLPGVITRAFRGMGPVMTLHRPGGHEKNLATRAETERYAFLVSEAARAMIPGGKRGTVRGPLHTKVGKASVSSSAFADDALITISFAPLGSDDLDTKVEQELAKAAAGVGLSLSVVDAHNSINAELQSPDPEDPGWRGLFEATRDANEAEFGIGYCHSSELGFRGSRDITENGVGLFMVKAREEKSVLLLADANNAVPGLRGMVESALGSAGYQLIELCTSDSHNLAARGLTVERGYEALGEATPPESIAELAVKMAKLAETKAAPAEYASSESKTGVKVFGARALEEFAAITQSSSRFARAYLRFALVSVALLFVASALL